MRLEREIDWQLARNTLVCLLSFIRLSKLKAAPAGKGSIPTIIRRIYMSNVFFSQEKWRSTKLISSLKASSRQMLQRSFQCQETASDGAVLCYYRTLCIYEHALGCYQAPALGG